MPQRPNIGRAVSRMHDHFAAQNRLPGRNILDHTAILRLHEIPGLSLTEFHNYAIAWTVDAVKWYVDGQLIRSEYDIVPQHPSELRLNVWAPAANFVEAYDASLSLIASDDPIRVLQVFEIDETIVSSTLAGDTNADRVVDITDLNNVRNSFGCEHDLCSGDAIPFDGVVNMDDLNTVRNNFDAMGPDDGTLEGDAFPFDGMVNINDLNGVRNNFGVTASAVPEPSTLALASLFAFVGIIVRWRRI